MAQPAAEQLVLIVRTADEAFALPMDAVEQTFDLGKTTTRGVGGGAGEVVLYRGSALEFHSLAGLLGLPRGGETAGVVLWAGGRRRVFAVDGLVGQQVADVQPVPPLARGAVSTGILLNGDEVVPVLDPGAVCGAYSLAGDSFGYGTLQRSALAEIANIGSGHAATALSELLGKPVEIEYTEALLTTLAQAADRLGSATSQSAVVDTPVAEGGRILLLLPDETASQLCELLGTTIEDEMGRSALREVGNILGSSYLNAIVEFTGLSLEPEPPEIDIDLLGHVVERRLTRHGNLDDPSILMRSQLTVEAAGARFSFLFVPQIGTMDQLLDALGVG